MRGVKKTKNYVSDGNKLVKLAVALSLASVYGSAFSADVVGNVVQPPNGSAVMGSAHYGGRVGGPYGIGKATENKLIHEEILYLNGGLHYLYGGYSSNGEVSDNEVQFTKDDRSGNYTFNVFGGMTQVGKVEENSVKVKVRAPTSKSSTIYGGWTSIGDATRNKVDVSESTGIETVIGAYISTAGNAEGNEVTISNNSTIKNQVRGALVEGSNNSHFVRENRVRFLDSTMQQRGTITGGESNGNNSLVTGNEVYVRNSEIFSVVGGRARNGDATNNKVLLEDVIAKAATGTIPTNIVGGELYQSGSATGNTVEIRGQSTINGFVAGGYALRGSPDIRNNTVNLNGRVNVTGTIYGGVVGTSAAGMTPVNDRPNKLSMTGRIVAGNIDGFSDLDLNVSSNNELTSANNEYVLTLTRANQLDMSNRTLNIIDADPSVAKDPNKRYGLIKLQNPATGGSATPIKLGSINRHSTFTSTKYDLSNTTSGELYLKGKEVLVPPSPGPSPSPGPKAPDSRGDGDTVIPGIKTANKNADVLMENRLASLAMVNNGAHFVADSVIGSVRNRVGKRDSGSKDQMYGKYLFAAGEAGANRFGKGSHHFDLNGGSMITGGMSDINGTYLGGFFEASWGHASSKQAGLSAKGNLQSYGVGLLVFRDLTDHFTIDGSVRLGYLSNHFKGNFYRFNDKADYKTQGVYTSLHLGANYEIPLTEQISVSLFGRYIFSYIDGDKEKIGKGRVTFNAKDATSHTLNAGAKANFDLTPNLRLVGGLGVEQTMGAHSKGSIDGATIHRISINGTTGFSELLLQGKPSTGSPWQFDIGVKGYAGVRDGVMGNGRISYRF